MLMVDEGNQFICCFFGKPMGKLLQVCKSAITLSDPQVMSATFFPPKASLLTFQNYPRPEKAKPYSSTHGSYNGYLCTT